MFGESDPSGGHKAGKRRPSSRALAECGDRAAERACIVVRIPEVRPGVARLRDPWIDFLRRSICDLPMVDQVEPPKVLPRPFSPPIKDDPDGPPGEVPGMAARIRATGRLDSVPPPPPAGAIPGRTNGLLRRGRSQRSTDLTRSSGR